MSYISQPIRVRYSDTDQMGYMHHSNYLRFFEIARLEWLTTLGISYKEMEKSGIWLPVAAASVHFKNPAYFDDALRVRVQLDAPPMASLLFSYEVHNQDAILVCTGNTKLAFLDAQLGRPMRCPENLRQLLRSYL
ncbi:MAG: acyl-CoA thioesterase [Flavobacteriaceae bacterium]